MPTLDHNPPPLPYILEGVALSHEFKNLAVVCNGGHGRSACIVLCIIVHHSILDPSVLKSICEKVDVPVPNISKKAKKNEIVNIGKIVNKFMFNQRKCRKNMYEQTSFLMFADWVVSGGTLQNIKTDDDKWIHFHTASEYFKSD
ncbi:hypothetical protein TL16_g07663 [Triparma laevis f. inornata]|nr:hypothetical protein TL16_g07663 [Triparma laevis f. inornata]